MNFEDKVLALFDNGRRSAVYVAGYQSARAQAASIAAEADRLIAEMAVENADLKEQLSAKDAELERLVEALEMMVEMVEFGGFGRDAAMDTARAALAAHRKQGGE